MYYIAAFGGAVVSAFFMSLIGLGINLEQLIEFVYKYQTLLAGAGALLGAFFTVRAIHRQIEKSDDHVSKQLELERGKEDNRRLIMRTTLRVSLLIAIQEVSKYSHACSNLVEELDGSRAVPPKVPTNAMEIITKYIGVANAHDAKYFVEWLRELQVLSYAVSVYVDDSVLTGWRCNLMMSAAKILAFSAMAYPYASSPRDADMEIIPPKDYQLIISFDELCKGRFSKPEKKYQGFRDARAYLVEQLDAEEEEEAAEAEET